MKDWIKQLFAAIDRKDAGGFVSFLTEDACFRFANAPVICQREEIRKAVALFFSSVKSLRHHVTGVWERDGIVICQGEVTYGRLDDTSITLPFADIWRMRDSLIADYRIYMDISPLGS